MGHFGQAFISGMSVFVEDKPEFLVEVRLELLLPKKIIRSWDKLNFWIAAVVRGDGNIIGKTEDFDNFRQINQLGSTFAENSEKGDFLLFGFPFSKNLFYLRFSNRIGIVLEGFLLTDKKKFCIRVPSLALHSSRRDKSCCYFS